MSTHAPTTPSSDSRKVEIACEFDKLEAITVDTAGREMSTSRLIGSSPERVYRAWVEPTHLARWWGPKGFTNEFEICEPTPGGRWKFVMISPTGVRYPNECAFVVLVPAAKVVIDHVVPPLFRLIAKFEAEGNRTQVSWRQIFESKEVCDKVKGIVGSANEENLDRLTAELATMK